MFLNSAPHRVKRSAIRVRIVEDILQLIRRGKSVPGDRLPSEPTLAAQLGVSRPSLREALSVLDTLGVVEVKRGSGVFVKDARAADHAGGIPSLGRQGVSEKESADFAEVLHDIRVILEPLSARLAARNARRDDIALIRFELRKLAETAKRGDIVGAAHADVAFHAAIAAASGSKILMSLLRAVEGSLRHGREARIGAFWDQMFVVQAHETIFEAIRRRDPVGAEKAMKRHLEDIGRIQVKVHSKRR